MFGWAIAGLMVASGASQRRSARKSAKEMRRLGQQNARNIRAEGAEEYTRSSRSFEQIIGKSKAIVAGAGISGVSKRRYISGLETEASSQLDWINSSTTSRANLAISGAIVQSNQLKRAGDAALMNSLVSAFSAYTMLSSGTNVSKPSGKGPSRSLS